MAQLRIAQNRQIPKPHPIRLPLSAEDIDFNFDLLYKVLSGVKGILDDILPASRGGTGIGSYFKGDLLVATAPDTLGTINATTVGYVLRTAGVLTEPQWGKVSVVDPDSHLTGLTSKGDLIAFNGTSYSRLPAGADGLFLRSSSSTAIGLEWSTASGGGSGDIDTILTDGDHVMLDDDGNVLYSG